jgi:tetratricopeptide (TPR) repeat protein
MSFLGAPLNKSWLCACILPLLLVLLPAPAGAVVLEAPRTLLDPAQLPPTPNRSAIVIGNSVYSGEDTRLKTPANDARDVAEELKSDGFDSELGENLTRETMAAALQRFYEKIRPGGFSVIFFSGIGIQSDKQTYLMPVDARIAAEADVAPEGVSLNAILAEMHRRGAHFKVAFIDAARQNNFERSFRDSSRGLAPAIAPPDSVVMFSRAIGEVEKESGGDSGVFVGELLSELSVPNSWGEEALNRTRLRTARATKTQQIPWLSVSTADDFVFNPSLHPARPAPPAPVVTPSTAVVSDAARQPPPRPPVQPKRPVDMMCKVPEPGAEELSKDPRLKTLNARLAENPDDREALERRSQLYGYKGANTLALADLDAAIRLGAGGSDILNDRCFSRAVLDDLSGAARDCDEALRLEPNSANTLDSRGFVRLKSGQLESAIADFDAALKIDPKLAASFYARGIAKLHLGDSAGGEEDLHAGMNLDSLIGNELASLGIPDPHPEWGLSGVVHISETGEVTIANGYEINGAIADTRQSHKPGDDGYDALVRHLCGLKPGDQKFFRPYKG